MPRSPPTGLCPCALRHRGSYGRHAVAKPLVPPLKLRRHADGGARLALAETCSDGSRINMLLLHSILLLRSPCPPSHRYLSVLRRINMLLLYAVCCMLYAHTLITTPFRYKIHEGMKRHSTNTMAKARLAL